MSKKSINDTGRENKHISKRKKLIISTTGTIGTIGILYEESKDQRKDENEKSQ